MRQRHGFLDLLVGLCLGLGIAGSPAAAAPTLYTASFEVFLGEGEGTLAARPLVLDTGTASATASAFSLPSGAFAYDAFEPIATNVGGTVPVPPTPYSLYQIHQVVNQASDAGRIAPGAAPGGGFGGTFAIASLRAIQIGLVGVPTSVPIGTLVVTTRAGSSGTQTARAGITPNAVTVSVAQDAWTTGTVTFDDRRLGTGTRFGQPASNPAITSGTVHGHGLRATLPTQATSGSTFDLQLVTPITIRQKVGNTSDLRAGYARLTIRSQGFAVFDTPEPGSALLVALAATSLVAHGRSRT